MQVLVYTFASQRVLFEENNALFFLENASNITYENLPKLTIYKDKIKLKEFYM